MEGDAQFQNRGKHEGFRGYRHLGEGKEQQQQQQNSRVLQTIEKWNSSYIAVCGWGTWFSILR